MAFEGDLGRVQGASMFHTMAASGTSVAVSSLQPQGLAPFVGDAVMFSNGDVRQITAVNASTVTLGAVLYSYKGDPGIGNAQLLNGDGDSTVNGATQAAVKGVLQGKNYYNLNMADTNVSNGNGTGKTTRATQIYKFTGNEDCQMNGNNTGCIFLLAALGLPEGIYGSKNIISNILPTANNYSEDIYGQGMDYAISFGATAADRIAIRVASIEQTVAAYRNWLLENDLYVQYRIVTKYQYEEQVIDNQPIHIGNQEEEFYLYQEWRKGLNLAQNDRGKQAKTILMPLAEVGTYTLVVYNSGDGNTSGRFDLNYNGGSVNSKTFNDVITFTTTSEGEISIFCNDNMGTPYIMLNKGAHPYPRESYYGKIIREKDLSGIQLFPENVNPAQTIGGDWESLGSFTTSTNQTIYVWRKL